MLFFGLALAAELLEAELPDKVRTVVQEDAKACSLAARAQSRLFTELDPTSQVLKREVHLIGLRERSGDRMRLRFYYFLDYLRAVLKPNEEDRRRVRLPKSLSFLYFLLRPIRLVRAYGGDLVASKRKHRT
jgi:hypothetical protein